MNRIQAARAKRLGYVAMASSDRKVTIAASPSAEALAQASALSGAFRTMIGAASFALKGFES